MKLRRVPKPKFKLGQLVFRSSYNETGYDALIMISERTYTAKLGWRYGIRYTGGSNEEHIKIADGGSFWYDEQQFNNIENPYSKLQAEQFYREHKIAELTKKLEQAKSELDRINFSLSLMRLR